MVAKKGAAPPAPRTKGFRGYPLQAVPSNWKVDVETLKEATSPKRVSQNIVRHFRATVPSAYVAIFAGSDPPYVRLRLAKLTEDAIEILDTKTGEEELIETKEGQLFSESIYFVVNTTTGLAMGEYRPNSLSVLGRWPGTLLSHALLKLGTASATAAQPVDFRPFPTADFLQRAIGRTVKKFHLKMGPISEESREKVGVSSEVLEDLALGGNLLSLDLSIGVEPTGPVDAGFIEKLQAVARRVGEAGAKELLVTLEDKEAFDLLNENLLYYSLSIPIAADTGRDIVRERILMELQQTLGRHERDLLGMLPS